MSNLSMPKMQKSLFSDMVFLHFDNTPVHKSFSKGIIIISNDVTDLIISENIPKIPGFNLTIPSRTV
jgi:hypothetical protein